MGMIILYTHAQQMLFCVLGVFVVSILVGCLGVFILHRGVLSDRRPTMYVGWVVAGIGCLVYIFGWLMILSNRLIPDGPGNIPDRKGMLLLVCAVVLGINYAVRKYKQKQGDNKIVVKTSYVLEYFVLFVPMIMLFFY